MVSSQEKNVEPKIAQAYLIILTIFLPEDIWNTMF